MASGPSVPGTPMPHSVELMGPTVRETWRAVLAKAVVWTSICIRNLVDSVARRSLRCCRREVFGSNTMTSSWTRKQSSSYG